jgi:hypothetical protein
MQDEDKEKEIKQEETNFKAPRWERRGPLLYASGVVGLVAIFLIDFN